MPLLLFRAFMARSKTNFTCYLTPSVHRSASGHCSVTQYSVFWYVTLRHCMSGSQRFERAWFTQLQGQAVE
jgi:hypothetical protein